MARIILLTDFSEEYAKRLLKGIVQYVSEHEPWVLCRMPLSYRAKHGMEGVLHWAKEWNADGIIAQFYNTDPVHLFKANGIAAIAQDFKARFTDIPNITGTHRLTGRMGADYFIQKGFKHFAFYGFKDIVWSQERCDGFRETIERHNREYRFYEYQNEERTELWHYESDPLIAWLKQLPKPVAVMACDDNQAQHITEVCKEGGIKIPDEVSLLGVDNDEALCTLSDPPLSSIDQAVEKGGYQAAALLNRMIRHPGDSYEDIVVHPTHVVTRRSTDSYATGDKYISVILQHIHRHTGDKLSIADFTRLVPLSRRLLETRFKEVTGLPVYTYIMNLRMERFAQKLLETNTPVIELAADIHVFDYKNLARQFKKVKGCSPSEYRQTYALKK